MVICGNKCDMRDSGILGKNRNCVKTEDGQRLARDYAAGFLETSCKSGINIQESLVELAR